LHDCLEQLKSSLKVATLPRELASVYGEFRPRLAHAAFQFDVMCAIEAEKASQVHRGTGFVKDFEEFTTDDGLLYIRAHTLSVPQELRFRRVHLQPILPCLVYQVG
jgi:hypothetical protein